MQLALSILWKAPRVCGGNVAHQLGPRAADMLRERIRDIHLVQYQLSALQEDKRAGDMEEQE